MTSTRVGIDPVQKTPGPLAVAAGVLVRASGEVLVQQRTEPPSIAGLWEFPGGKIEPGESPFEALHRELIEEIDVAADDIQPFMRVRHAYPERVVLLDVMIVRQWTGEPRGVEGQAVAWATPSALESWPMLGANPVMLTALQRDRQWGQLRASTD